MNILSPKKAFKHKVLELVTSLVDKLRALNICLGFSALLFFSAYDLNYKQVQTH